MIIKERKIHKIIKTNEKKFKKKFKKQVYKKIYNLQLDSTLIKVLKQVGVVHGIKQ